MNDNLKVLVAEYVELLKQVNQLEIIIENNFAHNIPEELSGVLSYLRNRSIDLKSMITNVIVNDNLTDKYCLDNDDYLSSLINEYSN